MTTRGLRHIQMRENAISEQVQLGLITVEHIGGKHNLADSFTKEEKHDDHFIECRNLLVTKTPANNTMPKHNDTMPHQSKPPIVDRHTIARTNSQKNTISSRLTRDVADDTDSTSFTCPLRRARGCYRMYVVRRDRPSVSPIPHLTLSSSHHLIII
jgi:hypothetical protein